MSAHANDLRHWYAESLRESTILGATSATGRLAAGLAPGRYAVRHRVPVTAVTVWLRQGEGTVDAAVAAPSTPFDFSVLGSNLLCTVIVTDDSNGFFAAITNAGTVDLVFTKISRDRK